MNPTINVQRIAVEIGDIVKWTRAVNEIDRLGHAILKVSKESFRNDAITAARQQSIYDWLCSIGNMSLLMDERCKRINEFCLSLADDKNRAEIISILETGGIPPYILFKDQLATLEREHLHPEVYKHAKGSFQHEKYAHEMV